MRTFLLTFLFLTGLQTVVAAEQPQAEPVADAPGRVARLSYKEGQVEMAPAGTEEWTEALLNRPLTTNDRVWVGTAGKAELQVGSTAIYLNEDSGFSFLDLDDDLLHMSLTDGAVTVSVRRKMEKESIEIETPSVTVSLLHPGEYHIEVAESGAATVVDTRSGEAHVLGEKDDYRVRADERGIFRGTDELTANVQSLGPRTAFEEWANERERRGEASRSAQYVSRDVIGYEDLDDNGTWIDEPEYGHVWTPTYVAAGWAPYRFGRWVWVSPWGWTWVDNHRWGFAPFHYGRWAYLRSRWCWVPGPRHLRPVYAPALVGWVGGGSGISISVGTGIGWFPLGPREVYVPGYRYSRRYLYGVNLSNTLIINNTYIDTFSHRRHDYRYGRAPRAVTVVSRDRFVSGRSLEGYVRMGERDLRRRQHGGLPPAIAPNRSSVLASRVVDSRHPSRPLIRPSQLDADRGNSAFLARRTPPTRVSFDEERRAIEANDGRPVDRSRIITNNPRAIARSREDFRNEWARRRTDGNDSRSRGADRGSGDASRAAERTVSRDARMPQSSERQSGQHTRPRQIGGPDKSFRERTRDDGLSDRPDWARERGTTLRTHETQSESRTVTISPSRSSESRQRTERRADRGSTPGNAGATFGETRRDFGRRDSSGSQPARERALRDQDRYSFSGQPDRPTRGSERGAAAGDSSRSERTYQPDRTYRPDRSYQRSAPPQPARSERSYERSSPAPARAERSYQRSSSGSRGSRSNGTSRSGGESRSGRSSSHYGK